MVQIGAFGLLADVGASRLPAASVALMTTLPPWATAPRRGADDPTTGWADRRYARWFWALSVVGVVVMIFAWNWFGLAHEEEMTEQPKALSAGSTEAGFGAVVGGVPLVFAHLVGLVLLAIVAVRGRTKRWTGWLYAIVAVALTSGVGIAVAQVLWAGELFMMGVGAPGLVPSEP